MQGEPTKSCLKMDDKFDQLSNLPSNVIEKILSFLPIKEAVRTSIISSQWRYNWASLSDLVIDELGFPAVHYNHDRLVKSIDHLLFLHIGPIDKVKLSHKHLEGTMNIDRWMLHLSRNSIKEFTFEFRYTPEYKMPSCLFLYQDLVYLDLQNCSLKPPRASRGFKSLNRLVLVSVTLSQDEYENSIFYCPLLEELSMKDCHGFTKLKIDAPNLQTFLFRGVFEDLSLQNSLKLTSINISLEGNGVQRIPEPGHSSNLRKFFAQYPCVQVAYINNYFLRVRQAEQAVVEEVNSWLDDNLNFELGELQVVDITDITRTQAVLDFMKFLLLNSPVLEDVLVRSASHISSEALLETLIQFRRSSSLAEIICLDP